MCGAPARAGWSVSRTVIAPPWQSGTEKTLRGTRAAGPARSVLVGASRSSSLDVFTLHQRSPFAAAVAAALAAVGIAGAGIARREVLTPPWRRPGPRAPLKRRRIHTSRVDQPSVTGWPSRIALSITSRTDQCHHHRTAAARRPSRPRCRSTATRRCLNHLPGNPPGSLEGRPLRQQQPRLPLLRTAR
jgi:hypothetical protein